MRVLILGGHGFIGSHLSNILKSQGHTIGVVDCYHQYYIFPDWEYEVVLPQRIEHCGADKVYVGRIEDAKTLSFAFLDFKPDIVVHVATYPNAYMVKRNVQDATNNMVSATATILDLCVEHKVEKIVFASSSMVYGDFTETPPTEDAECNPLTLYGSYKLLGEKMCKIWNREKGLDYTILRPSALYGTRDMIVRVISKMTESALQTGTIKVNGPDNKLDFSWVEDVASAFSACVNHESTRNQIFNCTRNNGRKIIEAAELVRERVGGTIERLPHDSFYPNRDTLNSMKLREYTDWCPKVDIEEGIPRYLDWFLEQPFIEKVSNNASKAN